MLTKNHVIILYPLQIGDGLCSVISATLTSVSCVTTAHSPGNFTVDVQVEGMGNALPPEEGLLFTYVLEVNNVSHCYGYVHTYAEHNMKYLEYWLNCCGYTYTLAGLVTGVLPT